MSGAREQVARLLALVPYLNLHPEVAAQLKLACADTAFGGTRYGEQTRIINEALRLYFEGGLSQCIAKKQSPDSTN